MCWFCHISANTKWIPLLASSTNHVIVHITRPHFTTLYFHKLAKNIFWSYLKFVYRVIFWSVFFPDQEFLISQSARVTDQMKLFGPNSLNFKIICSVFNIYVCVCHVIVSGSITAAQHLHVLVCRDPRARGAGLVHEHGSSFRCAGGIIIAHLCVRNFAAQIKYGV